MSADILPFPAHARGSAVDRALDAWRAYSQIALCEVRDPALSDNETYRAAKEMAHTLFTTAYDEACRA